MLLLKLKLQYFGQMMQRVDSLEKTLMLGKTEGKSRRGRQRMRWLDSISNQLNGYEFEQTPGYSEGQGNLVCCSPQGRKESWLSNWTACGSLWPHCLWGICYLCLSTWPSGPVGLWFFCTVSFPAQWLVLISYQEGHRIHNLGGRELPINWDWICIANTLFLFESRVYMVGF